MKFSGPKLWSAQLRKMNISYTFFLYEFNRGSKAAEATQNIFAAYGEDSITEKTAQKWFARFKHGKPDLHSRKKILCIWCDMEGIIHYQLLERNLTVTAERYCQQLRRLEEAI
jgi:hypothetical protein